MKRVWMMLVLLIFLGGCNSQSGIAYILNVRQEMLESNGCTFDAVITADYGDTLYTFTMKCKTDSAGNLDFEVTAPDTISGITGIVSNEGGKLTFDDQMLAFEMLADGQITPASAPWVCLRALRGGYISAYTRLDTGMRVTVDDSYEDSTLRVDVWMDEQDKPARFEILWQGKRIMTVVVEDFTYL